MTDFSDAISMQEAAGILPGRPHKNTIVRWATRGIYGVKLKTARFAGRRFTRPSWLREFCAAVQAKSPQDTLYDKPAVQHEGFKSPTRAKLAKLGLKYKNRVARPESNAAVDEADG